MKTPFALALFITFLASICGCATGESQSFPGYDGRAVWTALTAVAQTPSYDDLEPGKRWLVDENQVWVDASSARIEIFRRVHRMEGKRITKQHRNERTWRFQILFSNGNTPSAIFHARGLSIPMQAQDEADRYFADVRELLRGIEDMTPINSPPNLPLTSEEKPLASQPPSQTDKTLEEILVPGGS